LIGGVVDMKLERWQELALEIELLKQKNMFLSSNISRTFDMIFALAMGVILGYLLGLKTVVA
jgi:hypothetical protein